MEKKLFVKALLLLFNSKTLTIEKGLLHRIKFNGSIQAGTTSSSASFLPK